MKSSEISLSVIMPVYNEQENIMFAIERTIQALRNFKKTEMIVINDGSNDDTNKKLIDLSIKFPELIVLKHNKNKGLAKSLKLGFLNVLNDYVLFNSADLPLDPKDICGIIEQKYPFDLLVLERKEYSGATNWRKFVSVINRIILHIFFPLALIDIADCNYTFIIKKDILKQVYPNATSPGFIEAEMILRAKYLKSDVKSIETKYNRRKFGKAHFGRLKDILLTMFDIIKFRIYSFTFILRKQ
ncbi:MAG: glycosyltransferase family 2 protein [Endomicrobiaceae bacterium]|nr:glycosyltransferase family 2 protein [Endomicrobiaceae bacterium]